ncbi:MAG: glycogen synthase [Alphaproteobacteria bacterium]
MRVLYMTNEFPPNIYGGAGVHVEYLSKEMAKIKEANVEVRSFHNQNDLLENGKLIVKGTKVDASIFSGCPKEFVSPLKAFFTGLVFNGQGIDADVVHCHTWYADFGGVISKILYGTPLVVTVHSLEPLRPWKREQLGRGYDLSSWIEKMALENADAIIAVSQSTKADIIKCFPDIDESKIAIIYNGIDINEYKPTYDNETLIKYGINPDKPYVLFVGRMTRQKGFYYLLKAARHLNKDLQLVLCAGDADTPEMQKELEAMVADLKKEREGVIWIPEMVSRQTAIRFYSGATVFCCPSIYEPFGIINLEAMSCGTPVVGSAVGGIKEVVVDGQTGYLVDPELSDEPPHDPRNPEKFAMQMAEAINKVASDKNLAKTLGENGRKRVEEIFSWSGIARKTFDLYDSIIKDKK